MVNEPRNRSVAIMAGGKGLQPVAVVLPCDGHVARTEKMGMAVKSDNLPER